MHNEHKAIKLKYFHINKIKLSDFITYQICKDNSSKQPPGEHSVEADY
jgi:hypothetical protein